MFQNQQQYELEKQARYLKYLKNASEATNMVLNQLVDKRGKERKRRSRVREEINDANGANGESATLVMNRSIYPKYRVINGIFDSEHRNKTQYPSVSDFVLKLQEPLKHVVAIRTLKSELYQSCNSINYIVLNGAKIPVQAYNLDNAYVYLNGYIGTQIANEQNVPVFMRIGAGNEVYPAITGDITQDPYVYVMKPAEEKLRRFHIKLMTHDGLPYGVTNARMVLTLAFYCLS
jgi:hypothetical protein